MRGNAIRVARAVSRVTRQAQQTPFNGLCARPNWSTLAGPSASGKPHIRHIQGASKVDSPELQQAPKVDNSMPVTIIQGSIQLPGTTANTSTEYQNADGLRFDDGRYGAFQNEISGFIPEARQFTDPVHTFAYGTDASFYRLNPKLVVKVHNEDEVKGCITSAAKHMTPVTFRAAGTSLSGQAITDSVLLKLSHTGKNFRNYEVKDGGKKITVEPGLIGGEVNRILQAYARKNKLDDVYKIGPDPSSIDSCMMGGIIANNSSGMCCGVAQNSYHTIEDLRIVFVDGTVLDTADPESCASFLKTHKSLVDNVMAIRERVLADEELTAQIRRKFSIKCTTGYSINALVDHSEPIEVIKRLMIGSEGTLGFVSKATYNTVPDYAHKASAFIMFPDVEDACDAAAVLRRQTSVDAVEMFDRAALAQCETNEQMGKLVKGLVGAGPTAGSLLIECRGKDAAMLEANIKEVVDALQRSKIPLSGPIEDYPFTEVVSEYTLFWDMRKGLIPLVGAARDAGTSMLIEDVACPVESLGKMTKDLIEMFQRHGYEDASLFGHALEGNLHLVFSQGFRTEHEVARYSAMMQELCEIVAEKHGGSLKAEHGTGRNVAPFVEMEWGSKATEIMWELKEAFDPEYVLNPGVILNRDPDIHRKSLKPSPKANALVDRCIECGFCESNCPSKDLSLTPRQRITVWREIKRLQDLPVLTAEEESRLKDFTKLFSYYGEATCAADGMCQEKCPVKINTGELVKAVRAEEMVNEQPRASGTAMSLAKNFGYFNSTVPTLLNTVDAFHGLLGPGLLEWTSQKLNSLSGNVVPVWNKYLPKGSNALPAAPVKQQPSMKVVYMPTCVTRTMGVARDDYETASVHEKIMSVLDKADCEVVYPEGIESLCCGMLFNSRGFKDAAETSLSALEESLLKATDNGKIPILCDTSPCMAQMKSALKSPMLKMNLYEPIEFVNLFLMDKLDFSQKRKDVAVHVPCSSKKLGIENAFLKVASACSENVHPTGIPCCGMAGDRGMRYPELTASSLQHLALPSECTDGYSTSRTCEMSLSNHSGINFRGMIYLVDEATTKKTKA